MIADLCGYVLPAAELLYERADGQLRGFWPNLDHRLALTSTTPGIGDMDSSYLRFVPASEEVAAAAGATPGPATFPWAAPVRTDVAPRTLHDNVAGRIEALDRLGIDLQVLHPGPSVDVAAELGSAAALFLFRAYNRYVTTYCERAPERLRAVAQVTAVEARWSATEVREIAYDPSVVGVTVHIPADAAPNHPNLDELWSAIEDTGLPVFLRRGASAHRWDPSELLPYLRTMGVLERFARLRFVVVGWTDDEIGGWARALAPELAADADTGPRLALALRDVRRGATLGLPSPDAVVWASHFPFDDPGLTADVQAAAATEAAVAAALGRNATQLLDRAGVPAGR